MSVIDEHLQNVPAAQRAELERIRQIVQAAVPTAEEVISYGMSGFKYKGKYLIGFEAFRDHLSLFPGAAPVEVLKDTLQDYSLSKGTIRFQLDNPLPEPLIQEILAVRIAAIDTASR